MDIKTIRLVAPPTPACFADRLAWAEYLASCMDTKVKSPATRPFVNGSFNSAFTHCADCTPEHRRRMCQEKRCQPPVIAHAAKVEVEPCRLTESC
jgi:hypothetical protein